MLAAALYLVVLARRIEIKFRVPYWSRVKPFVTAGSVLTLRSICIMTALSLMTTKAAALGTITIASHQVLVGVLTVAQFCPEPLSQAAQTFLANTAGALRKGTCTAAERRFTRRAGRLLLGCAAASGVALAAAVMAVATRAPQMFTSDPAVMASMVAVAPQLAVVVLFYTCVCALDGLTFAAGDMVYAASVQVVNLAVMTAALALLGSSSLGHIWYVLVGFTLLRLSENTLRTARYYFI
jgi:Na+-driven multidrug efflux pump